jgi:hypothetical protein
VSKKAFGWRPALAKVALLLLLQAGGAPVHEALRHERGAVLHGEVWRCSPLTSFTSAGPTRC